MHFTTVYAGADVRIGQVGSLLLIFYRGAVTTQTFDVIERHEDAVIAAHGKISVMSVADGKVARIPRGVRERALQVLQKFQAQTVAEAIVLPSDGLAAAVIRTFLVGFGMLARRPYPHRVFSSVTDALEWLRTTPALAPEFADGVVPMQAFLTEAAAAMAPRA